MSITKWTYIPLTEADAQHILRSPDKSVESLNDRIRANRRLLPVTTESERVAARQFNLTRSRRTERGTHK